MRILFFTHYYEPEVGPATKRIAGLAKNLQELGHEVEIVTGFPNYPSGIKTEEYKRKFYMKEIIGGIKIHRYFIYSSPKKTSFVRLLNYFSLMFSSLLFMFTKGKYDYIIGTSPPLFTALSGYIVSKVKKSKFVFDVRDIWPDIALEMEELDDDSLIFKIMNRISNFLYLKSDLVTVVTNNKELKILSKGIPGEKVRVISNGFDSDVLTQEENLDLVKNYQIKEKFTLIYAGIIGLAQGLEIIVEAAKKLEKNKDIQFLVIGDGFKRKDLEKSCEALGLNNIHFVGVQLHSSVISVLKNASASIVPLKNDKLQDSVPTKLLESLGVGCPVILSAEGEAKSIIEKSKGGLTIKAGDHTALVDAINKIYKDKQLRMDMGENGRRYVNNNFSRFKIANKLSEDLDANFSK
ncbi:glycosyltransferase family 4 protein [Halobacillus massiliensis]|uniref:glycosyltransferase family 4 protein n=1 Tax=Halobacillus massiliensis TaxID=1926286 RepID=UPI0015C47B0C|nr:glycosyltransferase family 4 protein [Halobacillus massiliensis]